VGPDPVSSCGTTEVTVGGMKRNRSAGVDEVDLPCGFQIDDLSGPEIRELLEEHLASMYLHSPPESVHALPIAGLRKPEITFWTAWENGELLGCGALKELNAQHAEIKSMRTSARHLRKGVATALVDYIVDSARRRGYRRLSLETGSMEAFEPARQLYASFGFADCGPFADYVEDPNSVFMTKDLSDHTGDAKHSGRTHAHPGARHHPSPGDPSVFAS